MINKMPSNQRLKLTGAAALGDGNTDATRLLASQRNWVGLTIEAPIGEHNRSAMRFRRFPRVTGSAASVCSTSNCAAFSKLARSQMRVWLATSDQAGIGEPDPAKHWRSGWAV